MKINQHKAIHYLIGIGAFLLVVGLYQLWSFWPSLVIASIQWQREVNAELSDLLYEAKSAPWSAGGYLILSSFIYGMLHSLGPGHGKVIVSTYLATHPTKTKVSLVITVISALLQALVAITLVSVLIWGFGASMRVVNDKANLFVWLSFLLLILVGALICYKGLKNIYSTIRQLQVKPDPIFTTTTSFSPMTTRLLSFKSADDLQPLAHSHTQCGCGHQHVADATAVNKASAFREYVGIIIAVGIRPCTGAIMVLLFANLIGLYWMGMLSALAMAIGTALTTSLIAIMTLTSKQLLKRYLALGNKMSHGFWKVSGHYLQLFGGMLLILLGLLLLEAQGSGMSPIFSV